MPSRFGTHAAAGVCDAHLGLRAGMPKENMDAAACIREFDGVGEQVVPHQRQQLAVRTDGHAVRNVRLNSKLFCLPCVLKAQQAFSKLLTQIVSLRLREDLLIFQLVQFENIGDQVRQAAGCICDGLGIFDALLFRQGRVLQQGTVVLDDGQRRFQLV